MISERLPPVPPRNRVMAALMARRDLSAGELAACLRSSEGHVLDLLAGRARPGPWEQVLISLVLEPETKE